MVVSTRKVGEEIVFGNNIDVMLTVKGDDVRIGITAPKEVVVERQEVHEERKNSLSEMPALSPTLTDFSMMKRVHVENLTRGMNDSDLEALFAPHGTVLSAHVVMHPHTGGSIGSGVVEMATCEQAQAAIGALNGKDSNGNTLSVNEALPPKDNVVVIVGRGQ